MTIKEQLTEAQTQIAALQSDLQAARKDSADAAENVTGIRNERDQLAVDLKAEKEAHAKTLEALQASAAEINALKDAVKAAEASAGKKAQDALAAIGAPAVEDEPADKPEAITSKAAAVKELERLSKEDTAKAREFYLKHKTLINSKGE